VINGCLAAGQGRKLAIALKASQVGGGQATGAGGRAAEGIKAVRRKVDRRLRGLFSWAEAKLGGDPPSAVVQNFGGGRNRLAGRPSRFSGQGAMATAGFAAKVRLPWPDWAFFGCVRFWGQRGPQPEGSFGSFLSRLRKNAGLAVEHHGEGRASRSPNLSALGERAFVCKASG